MSAPEKKPRRRLTPEERIAARKAEIAAIEAKAKANLQVALENVQDDMRDLIERSVSLGDSALATRCQDALAVLSGEITSEELHS